MFNLYPGSEAYQAWIGRQDLLHLSEDRLFAVLPVTSLRDALHSVLLHREVLFAQKSLCHRGGHTLTGIVNLNGTPIFVKRVDFTKKKFWGRLRYNLMPSRGLWSAFMASILQKAQLHTPAVLAAGETRRCHLLSESFIVTEQLKVQDVRQHVQAVCRSTRSPLEATAGVMLALRKLHDADVTHGDLKLDNFYIVPDGTIGYWDLDSALYWPSGIPTLRRYRNTSCLIVNLLREADCCLTREEAGSAADFINHCITAYGACDADRLQPFIHYWLRRFDIVNFS